MEWLLKNLGLAAVISFVPQATVFGVMWLTGHSIMERFAVSSVVGWIAFFLAPLVISYVKKKYRG